MIKYLVAVAACIVVAAAVAIPPKNHVFADCGYPNNSDTKIHVFNGPGKWALDVNDAVVYDNNNNTMYPIDPRKPMILDLISVNNGVVYTDNKVNVKLYEYTKDWASGKCKWGEIPTFGLLDNIDGCEFAHNCPLQTGNLNLLLPLDLSGFASIINTLASNRPYQLEVKMYDYNQNSGHEQIAYVLAQIRFAELN